MLSVIVPVYNAEKTIHRCLDSIIKQTYKDIEVIIIDDGSTDKSSCTCIQYEKQYSNIKYQKQVNQGVSVARNKGIEIASGDYIAFVDSDDYVDEEYYEQLISIQNSLEKKAFVVSAIQKEEGQKHLLWRAGNEQNSIIEMREFLHLFEIFLFNSVWNKIYLKSVIDEKKIHFSQEYSLGEDMLFNINYLMETCYNSIIICNQVVYHYVCDETQSLSVKYQAHFWNDHVYFCNQLLQLCKDKYVKQKDYSILFLLKYHFMEAALKNTMKEKNTLSIKEKVKINNEIMQSQFYRQTLKEVKKIIPKKDYIAHRSGRYRTYLLFKKLWGNDD